MDRRAKVELFEQLRREYEFGCGTIKGTAKKFQVHRRMVREALKNAIPPGAQDSMGAGTAEDGAGDCVYRRDP